ncbi:PREDICTED: F-box/kelch-repeat protein At5g49000-like [Camelina sativa]|uniref:F-box/kelch-repeat protein At5g49000-like n=1 Tax=Camelina sativa TaxID=90675 RepID=A0ABM0WIT0_CAMSA|nr:PREDICTED: F-box/kelch-repeat protein At5g49000-like [Camelina sativa]
MNSEIDFLMISPTSSKHKKRKTPIPSLPNDLLLTCFARLSRLYYPTLSLVSKSFQTLVASPELYKTRSLLNHRESCLYVCLKFPPDYDPRWFTLSRKPNKTLTKRKTTKSSGYVLVPISIHNSPPSNQLLCNGLVALGSNIYVFNASSSSVSILDCQFHTWHEAPSMLMKRNYPAVNVVDGKIYVAGGFDEEFDSKWMKVDSSNWMEVFDPKTQSWEPVKSPSSKRIYGRIYKSAVIGGEIYMLHKGVSYNPKQDRWENVRKWSLESAKRFLLSYCVIDDVLYSYYEGGIKWYSSEIDRWMNLKGLEGLPKFASYGYIKLGDYGGKMAVFWDKYTASNGCKNTTFWCAVISLERLNTQEIWGKVEWFDAMLTVPKSYEYVGALAVTL